MRNAPINHFSFPREMGVFLQRTVVDMSSLMASNDMVRHIQSIMQTQVRTMARESERHANSPNLIRYEARFDEGGSVIRSLLDSNHYEIRLVARPIQETQEEQETYDDIPF